MLQETRKQYLIKRLYSIQSEYDFIHELVGYIERKLFGEDEDIVSDNKTLSDTDRKNDSESTETKSKTNTEDSNIDTDTDIDTDNTKDNIKDKSDRVKRQYRKLAKITHPDSGIKDDYLYKQVTNMYENDDYIGLCIISENIGISYELSDIDISEIENRIKTTNTLIEFMKRSMAYRYYMDNIDYIDIYNGTIKTNNSIVNI